MKLLHAGAVGMILLLATSCADSQLSKGSQGAMGGAAGGALIGQAIGKDTESTLIGAAVGTMIGYIIGNEMDKYDRTQLVNAYERGPSGQPVAWVNPDSGNSYQVVPQAAYTGSDNRICRKAEVMATIDGRPEKTSTTACRDAYGNWQLQ